MSELIATLIKFLAGALAVAFVLAFGAEVLKSGNAANHASDLGSVVSGVDQLYGGQPTFSSLTTAVAYKYAPARMKSPTAGQLINPWGGQVTFAADANPVYFDVATAGVPDSDCPKFASAMSGYISMTIDGTTLTPTNANPVDGGQIATACGALGTGSNDIEFTFAH